MEERQLVPKRRFKGFKGEWKKKNFDEEIELYSGLTYSPNDVQQNGTFVLRSSNVQNGEIVSADDVYVDSEVVNSSNVREGDIIVVVRNGSRSLIGKHAKIKKSMDKTVIGAFMTGIRSNQPNFINALLDTQNFKREIDKNLGATINQITNGMFKSMSFIIPNLEEQQKIGEFFKVLDERIANQERKIAKVKALKDAYLTEMFPQEGEAVPKRRFRDFRDEWRQSYLLDNIKKVIDFRGRTPKKLGLSWSENGYLALSALNVKNGYIDYSVEPHYGDEELYRKWMFGNELKKNQVIFTTEAPMGNVAQVPDNKGYILSQRVIVFDCYEERISNDFFAVLLRSNNINKKLADLSSGGTAKGVSQKSLESLEVKAPSPKEQQKIGEFFKNLDNKIETEENKLDKLQKMKEAYLEEMFV